MSDGKSIARGVTDERGAYDFRPENHTGEIEFVASSAGHRAELSIDLEQKKQTDEISLPLRVASGLGYLLGISGIAMIYVSRRASRRN
jgi:nickel transport protein